MDVLQTFVFPKKLLWVDSILVFRFQQLEVYRKSIVGDLPIVSDDQPDACSASVIKQICHSKDADKNLRFVAILRMNCVLELSWRTMFFYDQALTRLHCDQFRKQGAFKASVLSKVEFPLTNLDCICGE